MNAVLKTVHSSNLETLKSFRYTPLAAIANLIVAPAAVSDEEIARRRAEAEQRKADRAQRKAEAKTAKEARTKALPPQVRMVILPDAATIEMLKRQQRTKAERRVEQFAAKPISEKILKKGLETDLAEEARRRNEEAALAKVFAIGYIADVRASALSILFNYNMNMEAKVFTIEELGFQYSHDHENRRDAFYFHAKSEVEIRVNGGAVGSSCTNSNHKPCGVELLTPAKRAEREAANAKLREDGRLKRMANKTVAKTPRVDKKKKDDDKRSKRGGE
jgi:hypothetical protein